MSLMEDVQARITRGQIRVSAETEEPNTAETGADTEEKQPAAAAPNPEPAPTDQPKAADPAEVAEYCSANGCAALAAPLIREKATMDQVKARVNAAAEIRTLVVEAGTITEKITADQAEAFIKEGLSVEQVRTKLWSAVVAAQSPEINSAISADTAISTTSWDKAVAKANARIEGQQPKEG